MAAGKDVGGVAAGKGDSSAGLGTRMDVVDSQAFGGTHRLGRVSIRVGVGSMVYGGRQAAPADRHKVGEGKEVVVDGPVRGLLSLLVAAVRQTDQA